MVKEIYSTSLWAYSRIYKHILQKEMVRLDKLVEDISLRNIRKGAKSEAMIMGGEVFTAPSRMIGIKASLVHPDLVNELNDIYIEKMAFGKDRDFIKNTMSTLIPPDGTQQDVRDSLSNMIVDYIPELAKFKRSQPEAFYIANNEIKMRQWARAKERLEFYIGNILVFS